MPDQAKNREDKHRLFSVYMRPWVLDRSRASLHVPHLADLDRPFANVDLPPSSKRRMHGKMNPETRLARSYTVAWSSYVRGNIVSRHAQRIIVQFMAACCGKSSTDSHEPVHEHAAVTPLQVSANEISPARVHGILARMVADNQM